MKHKISMYESIDEMIEAMQKNIDLLSEKLDKQDDDSNILDFIECEVDESYSGISIVKEYIKGSKYEYCFMRFHKKYKPSKTVREAILNAMKGTE